MYGRFLTVSPRNPWFGQEFCQSCIRTPLLLVRWFQSRLPSRDLWLPPGRVANLRKPVRLRRYDDTILDSGVENQYIEAIFSWRLHTYSQSCFGPGMGARDQRQFGQSWRREGFRQESNFD